MTESESQGGAPPEPPKSAPPELRPRRRWGWPVLVVVVVAAVAAAWLGLVRGWITSPDALAGLEARVSGLESGLFVAESQRAELRAEFTSAAAGAADLLSRLDAVEAMAADAAAAARGAAPLAAAEALEAALAALAVRVQGFAGNLSAGLAALEQIDGRIAAIEGAASAGGVDGAGLVGAEVARRVAELERAVAALEGAPPPPAPGAELEPLSAALVQLDARLSALEKGVSAIAAARGAAQGGSGALVVAASQLREALRTSAPFAAELDDLGEVARATGVGDPELLAAVSSLSSFAATGVPTVEELRRRFATVAGDVVAASAAPQQDGWAGVLWERALSVVRLRRTGEIPGEDSEARVARAEVRLAEGDLAAAVAEAEGLEGSAADAAAAWLTTARDRMAADAAAAVFAARALALLSASP